MVLLDAPPPVRSWTSLMNCDVRDGSRARFSTPVAHRSGCPHQHVRPWVTTRVLGCIQRRLGGNTKRRRELSPAGACRPDAVAQCTGTVNWRRVVSSTCSEYGPPPVQCPTYW